MTEYVHVVPDDPEETARLLLALADSPYDVQTSTDNGLTFRVPAALAARYEDAVLSAGAPITGTPEEPVKTAAPKRSRARRDT